MTFWFFIKYFHISPVAKTRPTLVYVDYIVCLHYLYSLCVKIQIRDGQRRVKYQTKCFRKISAFLLDYQVYNFNWAGLGLTKVIAFAFLIFQSFDRSWCFFSTVGWYRVKRTNQHHSSLSQLSSAISIASQRTWSFKYTASAAYSVVGRENARNGTVECIQPAAVAAALLAYKLWACFTNNKRYYIRLRCFQRSKLG